MAVSEKMSDSPDVSGFFEAIINQQGNRLSLKRPIGSTRRK